MENLPSSVCLCSAEAFYPYCSILSTIFSRNMASKNNNPNKFIMFIHRHPVLVNLVLAIILVVAVLWFICNPFLGYFTRNGEEVDMPKVEGLNVNEARKVLSNGHFVVKVDSVYDSQRIPGQVISQTPRGGSKVKEGREVYLKYVCYNARLLKVPAYYSMSGRAAEMAFKEVGFNHITIKEVPSAQPGFIKHIKAGNRILLPGEEIPQDTYITMEVGSGPEVTMGYESPLPDEDEYLDITDDEYGFIDEYELQEQDYDYDPSLETPDYFETPDNYPVE